MRKILYLSLILLAMQPNRVSAQESKKNILLILVDDLKPTLGVYGDETAITPNMDKLSDMGMRFDNAYCNQAVCVSSRYNLLLGSRSTSTGLFDFGNEFREAYPNAVTLPQYFKNVGYHTEAIGKVFHVGHGNTNDEASWSIPHHKDKVIEYLLPESTNRELTREEAFFENSKMYLEDLPPNNELPRGAAWEAPDVVDDAYADGRVANHAIDRLRQLKKDPIQPFLMAVGFVRPHLPFSAPKKYWDMYDSNQLPMPKFEDWPQNSPPFAAKRRGEITQFDPIPEFEEGIYEDGIKRNLIHGYYASTSYVDAQIGRVIKELERLEMADNTIIVLWGDHGWHLGDHGMWTKHTNYEEANRIPLLIVAPGVTEKSTTTKQFAESVDIYPTLAELANLDRPQGPQPIDGISLVEVLKDGNKSIRNHAYHAYIRGRHLGQAIRTDNFRLVKWTSLANEKAEVQYELYDYKNDPLETKNWAEEKPEVVSELEKIINSHPKPVTW